MKRIVCLTFSIIVIFFSITVNAEKLPKIFSSSYFLADISNDTVLAEKNSDVTFKPADFSKFMVAYIISETYDYNKPIPVTGDFHFYNSYGNIASISSGVVYTVKQHLSNMLLLYSDASAEILASKYSGNCDAFTNEMNKTAEKLGMKSTVYSSPTGYDEEGVSKTTIRDQFILIKQIYSNDKLMDIFKTVVFELPDENGDLKKMTSRNHLLSKYTYDLYNYSYANGLMTSITDGKISIAATAKKGNTSLLAFAVNCDVDEMNVYRDAINLFEHGFNNFVFKTVCTESEALTQVKAPSTVVGNLVLVSDRQLNVLLPVGFDDKKIKKVFDVPEQISGNIKKGEKLGTASFYYENRFLGKVTLIASKNAKFNIFAHWHSNIFKFNTLPLLFIIVLFLILMLIRNNNLKKKALRKKRKDEIMKKINK